MDLIYKSTEEIFESFIVNAKFDIVAKEHNFDIQIDGNISYLTGAQIPNVLNISAIFGKKCIAFISELSEFKIKNLLSGVFIIVTTSIPKKITIPTLFCKNADQLGFTLEAAYELSLETRLPVNVVLGSKAINSLTKDYTFNISSQQSRQNISKSNIRDIDTTLIVEKLSLAEAILNAKMPNKLKSNLLSLNFDGDFLNYIIPHISPNSVGSNFKVYKKEIESLKPVLELLNIKFDMVEISNNECNINTRNALCPGCPFVSIFTNLKLNDYYIFSNIKCKSIYESFGINHMSMDEFYGLLFAEIKQNFLFIANYSDFNQKYLKNVDVKGKIILLKDTEIDREFFKLTKYPYKLAKPNFIFPYSCENINSYKIPKVKSEKCSCIRDGKIADCMTKTSCPAIKTAGSAIKIDPQFCTGCRACVAYCPKGAIK
ncbi:4Fe-4S binding protein [Deferribacteraceae bacterium V6Fe1]|nr:4Fe-4S binding protein [Deferribacteraceae bacterium V6Fe1]